MVGAGSARLITLPLTAIASIATAKITISSSGIELYGYINTIALLFQLLPFADFGVGAVVTSAVARRGLSRKDAAMSRRSIFTAFRLLSFTSGVLVAMVIVCGSFFVWPRLLNIPDMHLEESNLAICIALVLFFLAVPLGVGQRILVGSGKSHVLAFAGIALPVVVLGYTLVAAALNFEGFLFAVGSSLAVLVTNLIGFIVGLRAVGLRVTEVFNGAWGRSRSQPVTVFHTAWPMLVVTIATAIAIQSHRIILSHTSAPIELTQYSLVAQLFFPIWSIVYMSSTVLWPRFSRNERQFGLWLQSNAILMFIGCLGAAGLVVVGPFVVQIMSGGALAVPPHVFWAFGALLVGWALNSTQTMLLTKPRRLKVQAVLAILMVALSIPLSIALSFELGASGPVVGTLISLIICQLIPGIFIGCRVVRGRGSKESAGNDDLIPVSPSGTTSRSVEQ